MSKRLIDVNYDASEDIKINISDTPEFEEVDFTSTTPTNKENRKQLPTGLQLQIEELIGEQVDLFAKADVIDVNNISNCPRCGKILQPAISIEGVESPSWLECPECGTLINTYKPLPYQAEFLSNPARYKMTAGGFGSGKSRTDIEDVIKHLLLIPRARVCISARTFPQLESTFAKEFAEIFPAKLLKRKNDQKHEYTLTNGSTLIYRSFDDPTKLKSLNLSKVVIVEASDVPESGFTMMQTRLRNTAAMIPEVDYEGKPVSYWDEEKQTFKIKYVCDARSINLETNPSSNWVKSFLETSATVKYFGSAKDEGYNNNKPKNRFKYTQVVSTDANPFLPADYIEEQSAGKTDAWVRQFIRGSFNFNLLLIYPNYGMCITKDFKLPREFNEQGQRVLYYCIGVDYGIKDNTHVVYTALSLEESKLYVYDELVINNSDITTIAKEYRHNTRINGTNLKGLLMLPRFDGRSYNKRESDLHTIGGAFEAQGLYFEPSFPNHEIRMIKMNALINNGQLVVSSRCEYLNNEFTNYKSKVDKNGNPTGQPEDGKDHGISALSFVVVELPHNLKFTNVRTYIPVGTEILHDRSLINENKPKVKQYNPLEEENPYAFTNSINNHNHPVVYSPISYDNIIDGYEEEQQETRELRSVTPYY